MWYAISPEYFSVPTTSIVQVHKPVIPEKPIHKKAPPKGVLVVLPGKFAQTIVVPKADESSERKTLAYIAQKIGVSLHFAGPDFALFDNHLPYNQPVPAFYWLFALQHQNWLPGTLRASLSRQTITVANDAPGKK